MERPKLHLEIPFPTAKEAEIAYNSLRVDKEPKRNQVEKRLTLAQNKLILDLEADEVRNIRASVGSFFEHLILVQKTIAKFSLPDPLKKETS